MLKGAVACTTRSSSAYPTSATANGRRDRRAGRCAVTRLPLQAHCREYLAGYKIPRTLHVVDAVRRSDAGKVDYAWARAVAGTA